MRPCQKCGTALSNNQKICPDCGAEQVETVGIRTSADDTVFDQHQNSTLPVNPREESQTSSESPRKQNNQPQQEQEGIEGDSLIANLVLLVDRYYFAVRLVGSVGVQLGLCQESWWDSLRWDLRIRWPTGFNVCFTGQAETTEQKLGID